MIMIKVMLIVMALMFTMMINSNVYDDNDK